jgi:hypothetical protein
MACAGTFSASGSFGPGWNSPAFSADALSNGLYYYQLKVSGASGEDTMRKAGKLFILR